MGIPAAAEKRPAGALAWGQGHVLKLALAYKIRFKIDRDFSFLPMVVLGLGRAALQDGAMCKGDFGGGRVGGNAVLAVIPAN